MKLLDVMDPNIVTVSANDYAADALSLMRQRGLSEVFVLQRDEVCGIVFAVDLAYLPDEVLKDRDVREFMVPSVAMAECELSTEEAEQLLDRTHMGTVAVMCGKQPVGVVTERDLRGRMRHSRLRAG
jgi:predicted transcriptional regulator